MQTEHDYLAFILIGGGSSYGRSPDKEKAIDNCLRALKDWSHLFEVDDVDVVLNVVDVIGYNTVAWGHDGVRGWKEGEPQDGKAERITAEIERVERHTAPAKKRRRK